MIEQKMKEQGYKLTEGYDLPPGFKFAKVLVHDNLVFLSGAMPFVNNELPYTGKVGDTVTLEEAQELAELCVLNALANLKAEIGSLDKVKQVLKITGFVASASGFTDQALVMNAASEMLINIFGEKGVHARTAVGTSVMPLNTPLEIEMIIAVNN